MSPAKPITEFIGTFFLVFTIGMTVIDPGGAGPFAPIAIATALAVMIYAGGHISGAHYNPAATLAVFLRGACAKAEVVPYVVAQLAAAASAAFTVLAIKPDAAIVPIDPAPLPTIIAEALFTFGLCYVILNVATAKSTAGNSYFGFAIGGVVLAGAYAVGPVSGASFNPAVTLGIGIMGLAGWADLWMHLVGELAGAAAAASVFAFVAKSTPQPA